jgi:hypothetical protein
MFCAHQRHVVRDFPLGDGLNAAINSESDEEEKEDPVEPSTWSDLTGF